MDSDRPDPDDEAYGGWLAAHQAWPWWSRARLILWPAPQVVTPAMRRYGYWRELRPWYVRLFSLVSPDTRLQEWVPGTEPTPAVILSAGSRRPLSGLDD